MGEWGSIVAKKQLIARSRVRLAAQNAAQPVERFQAKMARLKAVVKRMAPAVQSWCIVQTTPGRTLRLALSLTAVGFDAWTPCETRLWRRPRSTKRVERDIAILPTIVFVRADEAVVTDLWRELARPVSRHPPFSIFRQGDRVPLVSDSSITSLRAGEAATEEARLKRMQREEDAAQRKLRSPFKPGAAVRVSGGAMVGYTGRVVGSRGRDAEVEIMGRKYRIGAWLIVPDEVSGTSSPEDTGRPSGIGELTDDFGSPSPPTAGTPMGVLGEVRRHSEHRGALTVLPAIRGGTT